MIIRLNTAEYGPKDNILDESLSLLALFKFEAINDSIEYINRIDFDIGESGLERFLLSISYILFSSRLNELKIYFQA